MAKYETFLKYFIPLTDQLKDVHTKYKSRELNWEDYSEIVNRVVNCEEVKKLEELVRTRFKRLLKNIPNPWISILDFDTKYNGYTRGFEIKITKLKFLDGSILDDTSKNISKLCPCAHMKIFNGNEKQLNPGVKDFMDNYAVYKIINPDHYC